MFGPAVNYKIYVYSGMITVSFLTVNYTVCSLFFTCPESWFRWQIGKPSPSWHWALAGPNWLHFEGVNDTNRIVDCQRLGSELLFCALQGATVTFCRRTFLFRRKVFSSQDGVHFHDRAFRSTSGTTSLSIFQLASLRASCTNLNLDVATSSLYHVNVCGACIAAGVSPWSTAET